MGGRRRSNNRSSPYKRRGSSRRGRRSGRGRGRRSGRGGGRGSRREPKKEVTAAEVDAEMDNYHKYEGKLESLESAKAAGQPVLIQPVAAPEVEAEAAAEPEAKKEEADSKEE